MRYVTDVFRTKSRFVKYVGGGGGGGRTAASPPQILQTYFWSTSETDLITNKRGGHYSTGVNIFCEGVCKWHLFYGRKMTPTVVE